MSAEPTVTAALTRPLRGTDVLETLRVLRGELGAPHTSSLPVLPQRGPHAEFTARTCALLDGLFIDRQPHGWRLGSVPGADSRAAAAVLRSDVNALADVLGTESGGDRGPVSFDVLGPVSLAASVHVHNGEKLLVDHGARRDLAQSWCAGLSAFLRELPRSTDGRGTVVVVHEPRLTAVLDGAIPTASGYRTLRSVPRHEVTTVLTDAVAACRAGGVDTLALHPGTAPAAWAQRVGADAVVTAAPSGPVAAWEPLAAVREAGVGLWFDSVPVGPTATAANTVAGIWRPWRDLGMPARELLGTRLAPEVRIEELSPPELPAALARVSEAAGALADTVMEH